jgi:hypothetical protein
LSLRRWRPRHLFLAWLTYWVGLAVVTLGPAFVALRRLSGPNGHGTANAGFTNDVLSATIVNGNQTLWTGSISLLSLTLLLAGPPLALWIVWLITSSRTNNAGQIASTNQARQRELASSDRIPGVTEPSSQTSTRRAREES